MRAEIASDRKHIAVPAQLMQRTFPGVYKDKSTGVWMVPLTLDAIEWLRRDKIELSDALNAYRSRLVHNRQCAFSMKGTEHPEPYKLPPLKEPYKMYDHQIRAYNIALAQRSTALYMDMGTGKTLTAIMVAGRRYLDGQINRLLIVSPASVCSVWEDEIPRFASYAANVNVMLGDRRQRLRALDKAKACDWALSVVVINYESAWRFQDELEAFAPDMIILDESQRIKTPSSKQSKSMHVLGDIATYKLILTGTPIQKDTRDLWSQYRFLDPSVFACNYMLFVRHYANMGGFENHQYLGPRNLEEMTMKAHAIAYQVKKEDCLDLPDKVFEDRAVTLSGQTMKIYKQLVRDSIAELDMLDTSGTASTITAAHVLTKMIRLQQMTGGFIVDDDGTKRLIDSSKIDALGDIVDSLCIEEGRKVVIFARFLDELDLIVSKLNVLGIDFVRIDGSVPSKARGDLVKRFQTAGQCKAFVGELDACAEGLTLTAAQTCVYYSVNYNYAKYDQSLSRIHRIGQTGTCNYIHLTVHGTIDDAIMEALSKKEDLATKFATGWRNIIK